VLVSCLHCDGGRREFKSGGNSITLLLTADTIRRCNGSIADLRGRLSVHAAMRNLYFRGESGASTPRTHRQNGANAGAEVRAGS